MKLRQQCLRWKNINLWFNKINDNVLLSFNIRRCCRLWCCCPRRWRGCSRSRWWFPSRPCRYCSSPTVGLDIFTFTLQGKLYHWFRFRNRYHLFRILIQLYSIHLSNCQSDCWENFHWFQVQMNFHLNYWRNHQSFRYLYLLVYISCWNKFWSKCLTGIIKDIIKS